MALLRRYCGWRVANALCVACGHGRRREHLGVTGVRLRRREALRRRGMGLASEERARPKIPKRNNMLKTNQRFSKLSLSLAAARSEEHTSELQSRFDLVCRLLLEKKK